MRRVIWLPWLILLFCAFAESLSVAGPNERQIMLAKDPNAIAWAHLDVILNSLSLRFTGDDWISRYRTVYGTPFGVAAGTKAAGDEHLVAKAVGLSLCDGSQTFNDVEQLHCAPFKIRPRQPACDRRCITIAIASFAQDSTTLQKLSASLAKPKETLTDPGLQQSKFGVFQSSAPFLAYSNRITWRLLECDTDSPASATLTRVDDSTFQLKF